LSEVKSDKLTPVTATTTTFGDSGDKLLFATGTNLDMNGVELILDADADTSITADTDDQIDIKIAGADDFSINLVIRISRITGISVSIKNKFHTIHI
jgi:hypothetical protein